MICYWMSFLAHRVICKEDKIWILASGLLIPQWSLAETYPALQSWKINSIKPLRTRPSRNRRGFLILQAAHLPPVWMWITNPRTWDDAFLTDLSGPSKMFTPRKNSLPSPSLEDSFFPLSSSSSVSLSFALPSSTSSPGSIDSGGGIETDLILAAELGQALLEKNEELAASLEQSERQVEVWIKPLGTKMQWAGNKKSTKNYFG